MEILTSQTILCENKNNPGAKCHPSENLTWDLDPRLSFEVCDTLYLCMVTLAIYWF